MNKYSYPKCDGIYYFIVKPMKYKYLAITFYGRLVIVRMYACTFSNVHASLVSYLILFIKQKIKYILLI